MYLTLLERGVTATPMCHLSVSNLQDLLTCLHNLHPQGEIGVPGERGIAGPRGVAVSSFSQKLKTIPFVAWCRMSTRLTELLNIPS